MSGTIKKNTESRNLNTFLLLPELNVKKMMELSSVLSYVFVA
jgi:hypothetical protein